MVVDLTWWKPYPCQVVPYSENHIGSFVAYKDHIYSASVLERATVGCYIAPTYGFSSKMFDGNHAIWILLIFSFIPFYKL